MKLIHFIDRCYDEYFPLHQIIKIEYDNEDNFISIILKTGHRLCSTISKENKEKIIEFLVNDTLRILNLTGFEKECIIDKNYLETGDDLNFIRTGEI